MKRIVRISATLSIILSCLSAPAQAVPQLINYQGQLLDGSGTPLTNGDYVIEVRLFALETGGAPIWGPQVFNGQTGTGFVPKVAVVQGRFNLLLGPQDTAAQSLASAFASNPTVYLELKVGTGNPISPRQQILSAPFALSAANAANAVNAQNSVNAQNATSAQNAVNAQNATTAQSAVTAQSATTATTATTANSAATAQNADNAANAAKLNGYDWTTIFSAGDPQNGSLGVAAVNSRGSLNVNGTTVLSGPTYLNGSFTLVNGLLYAPSIGSPISLNDNAIYLRNPGDYNHYLKWGNGLGTTGFDGPMLVGNGGGILGASANWTLRWNANGTVQVRGSISSGSDRNIKQNFRTVDSGAVLDKVAALPITRWNYKDDPSAEHMGPVAQDFRAAFSLGTDDKSISMVDADGVALAAIQGLNKRLEEKDIRIRQLEQRLERLERVLHDPAKARE
jgi:hypothetical protein